jgi:carboxyl-terminal processing protease
MNLLRSRVLLWVSLTALLPVLAGGALWSGVAAAAPKGEVEEAALRQITSMLVMVQGNYATEVDSERAIYGAIDGMLRTLDPHSKFLTPQAFKALREDQTGSYAGLGIQVQSMFGRVTIVSQPFPESPAEKAGLQVGDMITHVNGVTTQNLQVEDVVAKLRGVPGTSVNVTIARPGVEKPLLFDIVRQQLKKYTINNSYMIRPGIAYIRIDSFAETTGTELRDALKKMDAKTLDGLVLDLRGNPGGLLQEAIKVGATFLQDGQLILKTSGRTRGSDQTYPSRDVNRDPVYPVVVLVDQGSASASEIVSGAIQDHDRGLVVGETTFGKGLVQSVYTLRNSDGVDSGLLLTTQKWLTPIGRLIQRDYSQISQYDYFTHRDNPADKKKDVKYSFGGRPIYGGGGITPDYVVEANWASSRPNWNAFQQSLRENYAFVSFVIEYFKSNPRVDSSFQVTDAMVSEFKKHLSDRNIESTDKDIADNLDFIKTYIKHEVFYKRLGAVEAAKVLNESDVQVQKALEYLPEAKQLLTKVKRQTAQR